MLRALLLTLAVEVPLYTAALVALKLAKPAKAAALGVAVNLATHPALWLYLSHHPGQLWLAEAAATAIEAVALIIAIKADKTLLAAVTVGANAASLLIGIAVG
ncbi:hypothetical protein ACQP00_51585 [Dactylosporangium sp. CS-047395]|uniref:hypothetical protein n=1 Tax=Dactylosporangium sp. CS-047395 TaxID=3239936 RepID=UPI003D913584